MTDENVIVVSFAEDSSAYEAFTKLKELDEQGQVSIKGAAIVQRGEDGRIATKDSVDDNELTGTATGGLIGLLVGILGGPFGVLIGGATGLLIGSLYDADDADDTESVLAEISSAIKPGQTVVLADVDEQSDDVVDQAMAGLRGTVLRRSVDDVEAEIAAAQDAARAAKREARKQLLETRRSRAKDEIRRIVDALKARAHALRDRIETAVHRP
ncbi:MAG TPA: DUF1269 domain-containing protein [Solirubrobacteraceae bacterium]|nr:DUF1269 domain-containing protein [Solirubrobacteraceae bacterium]